MICLSRRKMAAILLGMTVALLLVMMLTGVESIRDVILFPHMRPRAGT